MPSLKQLPLALKKPLPLEEKHVRLVLPFLKRAMLQTYDKERAKDFKRTFAIHLRNITPYAVICNSESIENS